MSLEFGKIDYMQGRLYKTFASCSGHYGIEFNEYFDESEDKLKEYQQNERIIINVAIGKRVLFF